MTRNRARGSQHRFPTVAAATPRGPAVWPRGRPGDSLRPRATGGRFAARADRPQEDPPPAPRRRLHTTRVGSAIASWSIQYRQPPIGYIVLYITISPQSRTPLA